MRGWHFSEICLLLFVSTGIIFKADGAVCTDYLFLEAGEAQLVSFEDVEEGPNGLAQLKVNVSEKMEPTLVLYRVTWIEDLDRAPHRNDSLDENDADDFLGTGTNENDKFVSVLVIHSMEGIVDYDYEDRRVNLHLALYFEFSSLELDCKLEIEHHLVDENTGIPYFENASYEVDIREDFPLYVVVPGIQPIAYDYDATTPNNKFFLDYLSPCPLTFEEAVFTCVAGQPVTVSFILGTLLDYEAMEEPYQYTCAIKITDMGNPPLSSEMNVTVTVVPYADEYPLFSSNFYLGSVVETQAGSPVYIVPAISAVDQDIPPAGGSIRFTMHALDDSNADNYFTIATTGEVYLLNDLDNAILAYHQVIYELQGCDAQSQCSKSILNIQLPTQSSGENYLYFERLTYSVQIYSPEQGEEVLTLHAQTSGNPALVEYSLVEDDSPGLQYFAIDQVSGVIITTEVETPVGHYGIVAMATDGNITDRTNVNIDIAYTIYPVTSNDFIAYSSTMEEQSGQIIYTMASNGASHFCLLAVDPENLIYSFDVSSTTGNVVVIQSLDADPLNTAVVLKIGAYVIDTCVYSPITNQLLRNEMLLVVQIEDINEFSPKILNACGNATSSLMFGYPRDKILQNLMGPIATIKATDQDVSDKTFIYSTKGYYQYFKINSKTGELYLTRKLQDTIYPFRVSASDGEFVTEINIEVQYLDMSNIFTIKYKYDNRSIELLLAEISCRTSLNVYPIYTSVLMNEDYDSYEWNGNVEINLYVTSYSSFVSLSYFNQMLESAGFSFTASSYTDEKYFSPNNDDAYKVATIALGSSTGLLLLILAAIMCSYINKEQTKQKKIQTLGQAYRNPNFRSDERKESTFATIFGNNPTETQPATDVTPGTSGASTSGYIKPSELQVNTHSSAVPPSGSGVYPSIAPFISISESKMQDSSPNEFSSAEDKKEKAQSIAYPSLETGSGLDYGDEPKFVAVKAVADAKEFHPHAEDKKEPQKQAEEFNSTKEGSIDVPHT